MNIQSVNEAIASLIATNPWVILIIIWSGVWKLMALWKAARNNNMKIFILLAIVNTLGIAEIAYLIYMYQKEKKEQK